MMLRIHTKRFRHLKNAIETDFLYRNQKFKFPSDNTSLQRRKFLNNFCQFMCNKVY